MRFRWLVIALLAVTTFLASGCASSRGGRYGQYGRYPGVYGPSDRMIYSQRNRDYQWERQQRARAEWQRRQRQQEWRRQHRQNDRSERRRSRDWDNRRRD